MWVQLMVGLVLSGTVSSMQCPDGRRCEGSSTCCKLSGGDGYACCTQSQPPGASLRMLPPSDANEASGVLCPNGRTCPLEYSCLHTVDASFGCCPWEKAVSCADGHHCCPLGSHCSVDGKSCLQNEVLTTPTIVGAVPCPDGESECPNDSTCCLMLDGAWGCCPMPEAACCADKIHCCPHGTVCDLPHARCYAASGAQPLSKKFPAGRRALRLRMGLSSLSLSSVSAPIKAEGPLKDNICKGNSSACPDSATCCLLPMGQFGCCPLQNAVCCSDQLHCCPQGTQCDLTRSRCTMTSRWSWPLTRLIVDFQRAADVQCDSKVTCPEGSTCCLQVSGSWGCCPILEGRERVPWLEKMPAAVSLSRNVKCDDEVSCPDRQTCCRLSSGAWGCCPFTEAVCCLDKLHCCPKGYVCDTAQGTCEESHHSLPWAPKLPAREAQDRDIRCNATASCEEGQTCCKGVTGDWSCCQLPNAVCCEDHQHCCPAGYTCNVAAQTCEKRQGAWLIPSGGLLTSSLGATSSQDVSCDAQHYCHEGQTCCKASSGGWACCPYDKGSCCSDRRHCCPPGFRCSRSGFECLRQKPLRWDADVLTPYSAQERSHPLL